MALCAVPMRSDAQKIWSVATCRRFLRGDPRNGGTLFQSADMSARSKGRAPSADVPQARGYRRTGPALLGNAAGHLARRTTGSPECFDLFQSVPFRFRNEIIGEEPRRHRGKRIEEKR